MAPKVTLQSFVTRSRGGRYKNSLIKTEEGSLSNGVWLIKKDYLFLFDALEKRSKVKGVFRNRKPPSEDTLWPPMNKLVKIYWNRAMMDFQSDQFDDRSIYIYRVFSSKELAFTVINIEYLSKIVPEFNLRWCDHHHPAVIFSGNVPIGALSHVAM